MSFCPNCGIQITDPANFCPSCGARLDSVRKTETVVPAPVIPKDAEYRVILVDKGECTKALCKEVLRNLLGYTLANAGTLIDAMPVVVAQNLTRSQAVTISEVMAEYGIDTTILDGKDAYVNTGFFDVKPVFSSRGTLLAEPAAVLRTLSRINQVDRIMPWSSGNPFDFLFRPPVRRAAPPQSALESLVGLFLQPEPPKAPPRPRTPPAPPAPPRPPREHQPVHSAPPKPPVTPGGRRPPSAAERAFSGRPGPDTKPPVPRPPVHGPGMDPVRGEPAPRRHTKPLTGPGPGRRP
ncbi:MAG: zinc ribbon domain-containing protein [Clostridia bacterium]|nr:zinc ribbon domain-containing protein [Clostridia bacterium]